MFKTNGFFKKAKCARERAKEYEEYRIMARANYKH
jgi:hypothetical protein